jgi:hypothetical protein
MALTLWIRASSDDTANWPSSMPGWAGIRGGAAQTVLLEAQLVFGRRRCFASRPHDKCWLGASGEDWRRPSPSGDRAVRPLRLAGSASPRPCSELSWVSAREVPRQACELARLRVEQSTHGRR